MPLLIATIRRAQAPFPWQVQKETRWAPMAAIQIFNVQRRHLLIRRVSVLINMWQDPGRPAPNLPSLSYK